MSQRGANGGNESHPELALETPDGLPGKQPSIRAKWIVSILVLLQFYAILLNVMSASTSGQPGPSAFQKPVRMVGPYLRATFQSNAYRFYAPNPGPTNLIWYRIHYEDDSIRWVETPDRDRYTLRMPYQRMLSVTMLPGGMIWPQVSQSSWQLADQILVEKYGPSTPLTAQFYNMMQQFLQSPDRREISPEAEICIASYVRNVARKFAHPDKSVESIQVYFVPHRTRGADEIQMFGREATDIRTYSMVYMGRYQPDGQRMVWEDYNQLFNQMNIGSFGFSLKSIFLDKDNTTPTADAIELLSRLAHTELGIPFATKVIVGDVLEPMEKLKQAEKTQLGSPLAQFQKINQTQQIPGPIHDLLVEHADRLLDPTLLEISTQKQLQEVQQRIFAVLNAKDLRYYQENHPDPDQAPSPFLQEIMNQKDQQKPGQPRNVPTPVSPNLPQPGSPRK